MDRPVPWWLRAYLLFGASQAVVIGLTGFVLPALIQVPVPLTPLNARFVAALYLAIAVAVIASAAVRRRDDARLVILSAAVATSLLLAVTLLHWPEFLADGRDYRVSWLGAYILDPLFALLIIPAAGYWPPPAPARHPLSPLLAVAAALFGALGLALLLLPAAAVAAWPWTITPLLAQLYSCFFLAFAVGGLLAAGESRPTPVRIYLLAALTMLLLVGLASALHPDRFRPGPATAVWFGALALGAAAFALGLLRTARGTLGAPIPAPARD